MTSWEIVASNTYVICERAQWTFKLTFNSSRCVSKLQIFFQRSWWNFARTIIRCSFGSASGRPRKFTMKQKLPDTSSLTGSILISAWIIPKLRERVSNYFLLVKKLSLANIDITTKRHQLQLICLCLWGNFVLRLQILKAVYIQFVSPI